MITTIVVAALALVAGLAIGWALGFEHCAGRIDKWSDAEWMEVWNDDDNS